MSARQRPVALCLASSRIVFTDSSRARSMKAHVLTMRHSASSGSVVRGNPASVSMPSISSESRSEEHTSELQSQSNLVCRLLLEKKKKKKTDRQHCAH